MADKELDSLVTAAISLIVIFVIIAIGTVIIVGVGDTTKTGFTQSVLFSDVTAQNATAVFVGDTDLTSLSSIIRSNDSVVLGSGNFTTNLLAGTVTFDFDGDASAGTFSGFNGENVNISAVRYEKGAWYNATLVDGASAMTKISDFNPTIALVVVSAIIIMIVIAGFAVVRRPGT